MSTKKKRNKTTRIKLGVALPRELVWRLDEQADKEHRSRSNMLCQFLREGLDRADSDAR
jgi:metal-responsive CopG/Arc/MetJ family transcriptional regulator